MKDLRSESGQMLVFSALTMMALVGFIALAADVGTLFHTKRDIQIAADAAATAGALNLSYGLSPTTAADNAAAANGMTNGSGGVVVTVNSPPANGYHQNATDVEVMITAPNPTYFMKAFGISSMNVSARAVAGAPQASAACVWVMDPTDPGSLKLQGAYDINAPNCGIYVNSDSQSAVSVIGGGGTVTSPFLDIVGGAAGVTNPTGPTTGVVPMSDPFGNVTGPDPTSACTTSNTTTTASFSGNIDASKSGGVWCFSATKVDVSGATLNNGIFVFENGVNIGVGATTTVNNGTLDVAQGAFTQGSGQALLNVTQAPQSGSYNGIALLVPMTNSYYTYQSTDTPTSNNLQVQFGSNNQKLDGYIYAPGATVYLQDNGGGITAMGIVAYKMFDKSSTVNIFSYNVAHPTTTPIREVTLVE